MKYIFKRNKILIKNKKLEGKFHVYQQIDKVLCCS